MKRRKRIHRRHNKKDAKFKKSLVTYVFMMMFFGFLFMRIQVPSFVYFVIVIPMTISIIHKYIDAQSSDEYISEEEDDVIEEKDFLDEDWDDEPLELEDMKTLRKEWKDSDFV